MEVAGVGEDAGKGGARVGGMAEMGLQGGPLEEAAGEGRRRRRRLEEDGREQVRSEEGGDRGKGSLQGRSPVVLVGGKDGRHNTSCVGNCFCVAAAAAVSETTC